VLSGIRAARRVPGYTRDRSSRRRRRHLVLETKAELAQAVKLVQPGKAGADDYGVIVFGACARGGWILGLAAGSCSLLAQLRG
jgi:hypothetical protein